MKWDERIERIYSGNKDSILESLMSDDFFQKVNAIAAVKKFNFTEEPFIRQMYRLENDDESLWGYTVSAFATAALHLMGIRIYTGNDSTVLKAIEGNLDFY